MTKPLLLIPPCPARWPAIAAWTRHLPESAVLDLESRFSRVVDDARDACAIIPDGSQVLAWASVHRTGDIGVLAHAFTRPEHRRKGMAASLVEALTAWFEMTGGRRLYAGCDFEIAGLYEKFGFRTIIRWSRPPDDEVVMLRSAAGEIDDPYASMSAVFEVRDVTRADWPRMVAMLTHRPGGDPRVALEESAAAAEATAHDLLVQQERGSCRLAGYWSGTLLVGLASVALDAPGPHTYAMMMPHSAPMPELREAAIRIGRDRGYAHVDFPLEALAAQSQVAAL